MHPPSVSTDTITRPPRVDVATVTAVVATLGFGAACWVVSVARMRGMDMGVATRLGSFPFFLSLWVPMMAAMMLPGVAPASLQLARSGLRALRLPIFVGGYLAIWALVGAAVYALYRPHGSAAAGAVVVAAGLYELTPMKRRFREQCRAMGPSGPKLGLCSAGSSIGLMLMMVALGAMSLVLMAVVTVVVLAQKVVAPRVALDVPVALAIVAFGIVVVVAPASIPHLVPPIHAMPSMGLGSR